AADARVAAWQACALHAEGRRSEGRPARRQPCSRGAFLGWTQSFARTRGRSRAHAKILPATGQEVKRAVRLKPDATSRVQGTTTIGARQKVAFDAPGSRTVTWQS